MYLVHFFDQANYEFVMTLHPTLATAEAAYQAAVRQYVGRGGFNSCGDPVLLYRIECDGDLATRIRDSSEGFAA
jgi:hypothetical protein